jgi:hypothetical protein
MPKKKIDVQINIQHKSFTYCEMNLQHNTEKQKQKQLHQLNNT